MTAGEARDRAGVIRGRLREVVRALSVPAPDWAAATRAMGEVMDMAARLHVELYVAGAKEDERGELS